MKKTQSWSYTQHSWIFYRAMDTSPTRQRSPPLSSHFPFVRLRRASKRTISSTKPQWNPHCWRNKQRHVRRGRLWAGNSTARHIWKTVLQTFKVNSGQYPTASWRCKLIARPAHMYYHSTAYLATARRYPRYCMLTSPRPASKTGTRS
jgi:hypothetical protein